MRIRFNKKLRLYIFLHGIDEAVWAILSALRGPDELSRSYLLGKMNTGIIRGWALSRRSAGFFDWDIVVYTPGAMQYWVRGKLAEVGPFDHFSMHIRDAARAIAKIEGWKI